MKTRLSLKVLFTSLCIVFFTMLSGLLTNLITSDSNFTNWLKEKNVGTEKLIIAVLSTGGLLLILTYFQIRYAKQKGNNDELSEDDLELEIGGFFAKLKLRYEKRYQNKLDSRFEITLEVSENWNSDKPITYKFDADAKISNASEAIQKVFSDKGRLLIVGSPGSGKTVLLLKLAIDLMRGKYNSDTHIPIIINLAAWSPKYKEFDKWLIEVISAGYGLSRTFTNTLLLRNQVVFLLDGLDELARNSDVGTANILRAMCLNSINEYLRMGRKAVICCRREEFVEMQRATGQDAPVSAKVEVLDLTKPDILLALQHAQSHAESQIAVEHLEKIIETNEEFLEVIRTPFYFTTAIEVFDKKLNVKSDFSNNSLEIKRELLNRFVMNKITQSLFLYASGSQNCLDWFAWLAKVMEKKQAVTFELADLQPNTLKSYWIYWFLTSLFITILPVLVISSVVNYFWGGIMGVFLLVMFNSLLLDNEFCPPHIQTDDVVFLEIKEFLKLNYWVTILTVSLSISYMISLFGFLILSIYMDDVKAFIDAFSISLYLVFDFALIIGLFRLRKIKRITQVENPYQRFLGSFIFNFSFLFILISIFIFNLYIFNKEIENQDFKNMLLLITYLSFTPIIIYISLDSFVKHIFLRFALYCEGSIPIKFANFLDQAAEARIMEKEGGFWRFRHQKLQEYFANLK